MFDASALLNQMLGAGKQAAAPGGALNQVGGLLGGLLQQSMSGLQQGASDIEKHTGVGAKATDALKGATGKSPDDLLGMAKDFIGKNQLATGAAAGGLGALLLGSKGGRGLVGDAAVLGGLAMIGGLAYNAYNKHKAGQATAVAPQQPQLAAPPANSGFGATGDAAHDNKTAMLIIRAMIAAAACDGTVDDVERAKLVGGLTQVGLDAQAALFLDDAIANPSSIDSLAKAASTPELALQVYAAARVAIDPDSAVEKAFLSDLASALKLDAEHVASIEAQAGRAQAA
jgi:uncharacterized membrane protein YebE (DUF533 family)